METFTSDPPPPPIYAKSIFSINHGPPLHHLGRMSYLVLGIQSHNDSALLNWFTHAAVWVICVTINVIALHVRGGDGGLDEVTTGLDREGGADVAIPRTDCSATSWNKGEEPNGTRSV